MNSIFYIFGGVILFILLVLIINFIRLRNFEFTLFGFDPFKGFREGNIEHKLPFFKKKDFADSNDPLSKVKLNEDDLNVGSLKKFEKNKNDKTSIRPSIKRSKFTPDNSKKIRGSDLDRNNKLNIINKKSNDLGRNVKINFTNLKDLIERVGDNDLAQIIGYFKDKNYEFFEKFLLNKTFDSMNDFTNFLKQELIVFLKDEYNNLKIRVSDLRKKGKNMREFDLRIMSIPLKIRIFQSTFKQKDFSVVLKMIDEVSEDLKKIEDLDKPQVKQGN